METLGGRAGFEMIDIDELKRKALACQTFHAAGGPVDDPHDTYPPDHYDAAVQPKYILELIERLEVAELDAARYRIMEAGADQRAKCLLHLLGPDCRKGYIHDLDVSEHEASPEVQMLAHVLVSERPGKFALIHLVAYLLDAAIAKGKT